MTRYNELLRAEHVAAHAYHAATQMFYGSEKDFAEAATGLELRMAIRAVKSFEERHPEVVA